jgi:hypothetical protein
MGKYCKFTGEGTLATLPCTPKQFGMPRTTCTQQVHHMCLVGYAEQMGAGHLLPDTNARFCLKHARVRGGWVGGCVCA